jgi:serine/threonine protein kinase
MLSTFSNLESLSHVFCNIKNPDEIGGFPENLKLLDAGGEILVVEKFGCSLFDVCLCNKDGRKKVLSSVWELGKDLLGRLHKAGYAHNDIQPGNIVFDAARDKAKLIDAESAREIAEYSNWTGLHRRPHFSINFGDITGSEADIPIKSDYASLAFSVLALNSDAVSKYSKPSSDDVKKILKNINSSQTLKNLVENLDELIQGDLIK